MDTLLLQTIAGMPLGTILLGIVLFLFILGYGADMMVDQAVGLSRIWGIPQGIVGATIVSLGTTFPEAAVSVAAAVQGEPDIALGNAVGSIICDTGLILGIANCMSPLTLERQVVGRQGWLQLAAGILLVACCFPWNAPQTVLVAGGRLPRAVGFCFLALLGLYIYFSIRWARQTADGQGHQTPDHATSVLNAGLKLAAGAAMVVVASRVLIPMVRETALRLTVPESIIGATLVAFGTSLPELVTAVTAVRKGHGELAVGNILGADILNVLFVAGAAAAVTPEGLAAPPHFFQLLFPAMLAILFVFRIGVLRSGAQLKRQFGLALLTTYLVVTVVSYSNITIPH